MHETLQLERTALSAARPVRGGLPIWEQKLVAEFIEEHLTEEILLALSQSFICALGRMGPAHSISKERSRRS